MWSIFLFFAILASPAILSRSSPVIPSLLFAKPESQITAKIFPPSSPDNSYFRFGFIASTEIPVHDKFSFFLTIPDLPAGSRCTFATPFGSLINDIGWIFPEMLDSLDPINTSMNPSCHYYFNDPQFANPVLAGELRPSVNNNCQLDFTTWTRIPPNALVSCLVKIPGELDNGIPALPIPPTLQIADNPRSKQTYRLHNQPDLRFYRPDFVSGLLTWLDVRHEYTPGLVTNGERIDILSAIFEGLPPRSILSLELSLDIVHQSRLDKIRYISGEVQVLIAQLFSPTQSPLICGKDVRIVLSSTKVAGFGSLNVESLYIVTGPNPDPIITCHIPLPIFSIAADVVKTSTFNIKHWHGANIAVYMRLNHQANRSRVYLHQTTHPGAIWDFNTIYTFRNIHLVSNHVFVPSKIDEIDTSFVFLRFYIVVPAKSPTLKFGKFAAISASADETSQQTFLRQLFSKDHFLAQFSYNTSPHLRYEQDEQYDIDVDQNNPLLTPIKLTSSAYHNITLAFRIPPKELVTWSLVLEITHPDDPTLFKTKTIGVLPQISGQINLLTPEQRELNLGQTLHADIDVVGTTDVEASTNDPIAAVESHYTSPRATKLPNNGYENADSIDTTLMTTAITTDDDKHTVTVSFSFKHDPSFWVSNRPMYDIDPYSDDASSSRLDIANFASIKTDLLLTSLRFSPFDPRKDITLAPTCTVHRIPPKKQTTIDTTVKTNSDPDPTILYIRMTQFDHSNNDHFHTTHETRPNALNTDGDAVNRDGLFSDDMLWYLLIENIELTTAPKVTIQCEFEMSRDYLIDDTLTFTATVFDRYSDMRLQLYTDPKSPVSKAETQSQSIPHRSPSNLAFANQSLYIPRQIQTWSNANHTILTRNHQQQPQQEQLLHPTQSILVNSIKPTHIPNPELRNGPNYLVFEVFSLKPFVPSLGGLVRKTILTTVANILSTAYYQPVGFTTTTQPNQSQSQSQSQLNDPNESRSQPNESQFLPVAPSDWYWVKFPTHPQFVSYSLAYPTSMMMFDPRGDDDPNFNANSAPGLNATPKSTPSQFEASVWSTCTYPHSAQIQIAVAPEHAMKPNLPEAFDPSLHHFTSEHGVIVRFLGHTPEVGAKIDSSSDDQLRSPSRKTRYNGSNSTETIFKYKGIATDKTNNSDGESNPSALPIGAPCTSSSDCPSTSPIIAFCILGQCRTDKMYTEQLFASEDRIIGMTPTQFWSLQAYSRCSHMGLECLLQPRVEEETTLIGYKALIIGLCVGLGGLFAILLFFLLFYDDICRSKKQQKTNQMQDNDDQDQEQDHYELLLQSSSGVN